MAKTTIELMKRNGQLWYSISQPISCSQVLKIYKYIQDGASQIRQINSIAQQTKLPRGIVRGAIKFLRTVDAVEQLQGKGNTIILAKKEDVTEEYIKNKYVLFEVQM